MMLHSKIDDAGEPVPSGPPSCVDCAKLIVAFSGIETMWLLESNGWKGYKPLEFLRLSLRNQTLKIAVEKDG